jgi:Raf kinase inhibitor-like YbhB/YbcL family protein
VKQRTVAICVATSATLVLAGCDTGDGKELKPFDPADYPAQTVDSTVVDTSAVENSSAFENSSASEDSSAVEDASGTTPTSDAPVDEAFSVAAPWLDGSDIDARHTCDGADIAPALSWGAVPSGTVEVAIALVDDSVVSDGRPFVHWVIGGLDPNEIALAEGDVPAGALQALNFFGDVGYGGPCPPPGDDPHLYRLTAYALNQQLELADGDLANEFLDTISMLEIASTDVTGFYQR